MKSIAIALIASIVNAGYTPVANSPDYIAKSATEKMDILWEQITANTTPGDWHIPGLLFEGMNETMDSPGDEFPCGWTGCRNKDIHSLGNVAKVKFVHSGQGNFTGMFGADADFGLMRLSTADGEPKASKKHIAPGMGLKFLRDGIDSANLVDMFSVDGQADWNFFANDWNTIIPTASLALYPVAAKFYTATKYIQVSALSNMAQFDQQGNEVSDPVFPFRIRFEPTGEISFDSDVYENYRDQLATIPSGTNLFRLYGMDAPEELGGQEVYMGDLVTQSECTTSNYGDEHLFFRH